MMNLLRRLVREEEGQGMVEYGLIIALIAIVAMVALGPVGDKIAEVFGLIEDELDEAIPAGTN